MATSKTSIKINGAWVNPTSVYVKSDDQWVKAKKVFVKHDGAWKMVHAEPIVITVTPTQITNSENSTVVAGSISKRWTENTWFNFKISDALAWSGISDSMLLGRNLLVVLDGSSSTLKFGGHSMSVASLDAATFQSVHKNPAFSIDLSSTVSQTTVSIKVVGKVKICGRGGHAFQRDLGQYLDRPSLYQLGNVNTPLFDIQTNKLLPGKPIFGMDLVYNGSVYQAPTLQNKVDMINISRRYVDWGTLIPDNFTTTPTRLSSAWDVFRNIVGNLEFLKKMVQCPTIWGGRFDANTDYPQLTRYRAQSAWLRDSFSGADDTNVAIHGGHALSISCVNTISIFCATATDSLDILCGLPGAQSTGAFSRTLGRSFMSSYGGLGLPGGIGSQGGYCANTNSEDNIIFESPRPSVLENLDASGQSTNGSLCYNGVYAVDTVTSNKFEKYWNMYSPARKFEDGRGPIPAQLFSLNRPLCASLNTFDANLSKSLSIGTPGTAINYNGNKSKVTIVDNGKVNIVGPVLTNGDGTSPSNWE